MRSPGKAGKTKHFPEQHVLTLGLRLLHGKLVVGSESTICKIDSNITWNRPALIDRLLRGQIDLEKVPRHEVSAAEADVLHLTVEQLLFVRLNAINFQTNDLHLDAHDSFLKQVDAVLFDRLAVKCLGRHHASLASKTELHTLGVRVAMLMGAAEMMDADSQGLDFSSGTPRFWAFPWVCQKWPECNGALFQSDDLWVDVLPSDQQDVIDATGGQFIAAVYDKSDEYQRHAARRSSASLGASANLQWEVCLLDPSQENTLDVLSQLVHRTRRESAYGVRFQVADNPDQPNMQGTLSESEMVACDSKASPKRARLQTWKLATSLNGYEMRMLSTQHMIDATSPALSRAGTLRADGTTSQSLPMSRNYLYGCALLIFSVGAGLGFGIGSFLHMGSGITS